jgi:hypothetical protein
MMCAASVIQILHSIAYIGAVSGNDLHSVRSPSIISLVVAHYAPQLQLEMLCVGPECQSAVMIRQTETAGAIIFTMHRDNKWIDSVEAKKPPLKNIFWDSHNMNDRSRYLRFAKKTKEIRNSPVALVARIHNDEIQRIGDHTSLFLD